MISKIFGKFRKTQNKKKVINKNKASKIDKLGLILQIIDLAFIGIIGILLTFRGIKISQESNTLSQQGNEWSYEQLQIMYAEKLPQFSLNSSYINSSFNFEGNNYEESIVNTISNSGADISHVEINIMSIIEIYVQIDNSLESFFLFIPGWSNYSNIPYYNYASKNIVYIQSDKRDVLVEIEDKLLQENIKVTCNKADIIEIKYLNYKSERIISVYRYSGSEFVEKPNYENKYLNGVFMARKRPAPFGVEGYYSSHTYRNNYDMGPSTWYISDNQTEKIVDYVKTVYNDYFEDEYKERREEYQANKD